MEQNFNESDLDVRALAGVLHELTDIVTVISQTEREKAQAVSLNQHEQLAGCIKEEQAHILKLRGLENRRLGLLKKCGGEELTFRQLLELVSPEASEQLSPLFQKLESALAGLQSNRQDAERIINVKLHDIRRLLEPEPVQTGSPADSADHIRNKYV